MHPGLQQPLPHQEYAILRALIVSPAACRWIEDMGIPFTIFTDKRARCLAVWAVSKDCKGTPTAVVAALAAAHPDHRSIIEWMAPDLSETKPEWANADAQRYCRELYKRWLPELLRDMATQVEQDGTKAQSAIEHLGRVIEYLTEGE